MKRKNRSATCSVQLQIFLTIFNLQLVESMNTEPTDMEGRLHIDSDSPKASGKSACHVILSPSQTGNCGLDSVSDLRY
jgi:hypothetical protein